MDSKATVDYVYSTFLEALTGTNKDQLGRDSIVWPHTLTVTAYNRTRPTTDGTTTEDVTSMATITDVTTEETTAKFTTEETTSDFTTTIVSDITSEGTLSTETTVLSTTHDDIGTSPNTLPTESPTSQSTEPSVTTPIPTATPPPTSCKKNKECNKDSEKCVDGFCVCRQGFTKSKSNKKDKTCLAMTPFHVHLTILKFGEMNATYDDSLEDRNSEKFKAYTNKLCTEMVKLPFTINNTVDFPNCDVIEFQDGSVITSFQMMMDPSVDNDPDLLETVIRRAIVNDTMDLTLKPGSLDINLLYECVLNIDDCHDYAVCSDEPGGYSCECYNGYKDEYSKAPGIFCKKDNLVIIIVGSIGAALFLALVVVIFLFYLYSQQCFKMSLSKQLPSSASSETSRSSSGHDMFPSQERLVLDLGRSNLMGASNNSPSCIGSDGKSLTKSERAKLHHNTIAMRKMPSTESTPGTNQDHGDDTDNQSQQEVAPPPPPPAVPHHRRFWMDAPRHNKVNCLQPVEANEMVMTTNVGHPFARDANAPIQNGQGHTRDQLAPRKEPSPQSQPRFGRDAPPPPPLNNGPDGVTSIPSREREERPGMTEDDYSLSTNI